MNSHRGRLNRAITWTAGIVGWTTVVTIVFYRNSLAVLSAGLPYLLVGSFVMFLALFAAMKLRVAVGRDAEERTLRIWELELKAQVSVLAATQLVAIGLFNIWSVGEKGRSIIIMALSYSVLVCFLLAADRFVAFTGNVDQVGGVRPGRIFNRVRSRRVMFWCLFVYPSGFVPLSGVMLLMNPKPYPWFLHPPQLSLLMAAWYSAACAGLVLQRYHGAAVPVPHEKTAGRVTVFLSAFCLLAGGVTSLLVCRNFYLFVVTGITILCIGIPVMCLSRVTIPAIGAEPAT